MNITTKFTEGVGSRGGAIIAEALVGEFGTVVMGEDAYPRPKIFLWAA